GGGLAASACCASCVTPPGVPLDACWKDEKTEELFLSFGASGENPLLVVGCSRGGRSTLGRIATPRTNASARYRNGRSRSERVTRRARPTARVASDKLELPQRTGPG